MSFQYQLHPGWERCLPGYSWEQIYASKLGLDSQVIPFDLFWPWWTFPFIPGQSPRHWLFCKGSASTSLDSQTFWFLEMASWNILVCQTLQNWHICFGNIWYWQPWRHALSWSLECSGFGKSYREWMHLWELKALHFQSYEHIPPRSMLTLSLRYSWWYWSLLWTDYPTTPRCWSIQKYCCTKTQFDGRYRSSTVYLLSWAPRSSLTSYLWTSDTEAAGRRQTFPRYRLTKLLSARRSKMQLGWCWSWCIPDCLLSSHNRKRRGGNLSKCSCIGQDSCRIAVAALMLLLLLIGHANRVSRGAEIWHPWGLISKSDPRSGCWSFRVWATAAPQRSRLLHSLLWIDSSTIYACYTWPSYPSLTPRSCFPSPPECSGRSSWVTQTSHPRDRPWT